MVKIPKKIEIVRGGVGGKGGLFTVASRASNTSDSTDNDNNNDNDRVNVMNTSIIIGNLYCNVQQLEMK